VKVQSLIIMQSKDVPLAKWKPYAAVFAQ